MSQQQSSNQQQRHWAGCQRRGFMALSNSLPKRSPRDPSPASGRLEQPLSAPLLRGFVLPWTPPMANLSAQGAMHETAGDLQVTPHTNLQAAGRSWRIAAQCPDHVLWCHFARGPEMGGGQDKHCPSLGPRDGVACRPRQAPGTGSAPLPIASMRASPGKGPSSLPFGNEGSWQAVKIPQVKIIG